MERFEDVGHTVYGMAWYKTNLRKDMLIFLALAQKEVHLEGFANTKCNCELFKRVRIVFLS